MAIRVVGYLHEHPVHSRGYVVLHRCPRCTHRTELVRGYFCRCGFDAWSPCNCRYQVIASYPIAVIHVDLLQPWEEARPVREYSARTA